MFEELGFELWEKTLTKRVENAQKSEISLFSATTLVTIFLTAANSVSDTLGSGFAHANIGSLMDLASNILD